MSNEKCNDLEFILNCVNEFGGIDRLGIVFETEKNGYFYDNGTGKVLCCEADEFLFFKWLFSKEHEYSYESLRKFVDSNRIDNLLQNIRLGIEKENLLQAPFITEFLSERHKEDLDKTLNTGMRVMTLELTEKCNLRCGYCIYNEEYKGNRNFSTGEMSLETVKAAVELLSKNSREEASLTFYGDEPLLKFDLIKYAVGYAQQLMKDKKLSFSITTNLTLMTKEMAEFFAPIDRFSIV